ALFEEAPQIDAVHLRAALALWNYCEASARYIFGDFTGDPLADNLLRALRTAGTDGMNRATINNHFGGHVAAPRYRARSASCSPLVRSVTVCGSRTAPGGQPKCGLRSEAERTMAWSKIIVV